MIYYLTALINGFFNSINRMTNVRAGKLFGTANGALINYVEATVLSLLLMLVLKNGNELAWGHIVCVPWWVYLGSICGLLAQLLQIVGSLVHLFLFCLLSIIGICIRGCDTTVVSLRYDHQGVCKSTPWYFSYRI